jgi:hypothetical protein
MAPHLRVYLPAWTPIRTLGLLAVVTACGHTDPFASPPYGTDAPFDPAPPVRLTFNPLADRGGVWLPDGSGILFSAQQIGRTDHDVCLGLLPPTGGRERALTCDLSVAGVDSTNAIESAAPAADGRLAFVESSTRIGGVAPLTEGIAIAPTLDPRGASIVQQIPYTIPGEPTHSHVSALRWLGSNTLAFVGGSVAITADCFQCPPDTVVANLKVVTLNPAGGNSPAAVPGTDFASGVSRGSTDDEIYYTVSGDSRVLRRTLSTGTVDVAYDFGASGIARDVQVVGGRLTAVVGGRVAFVVNPVLGPTQRDSGGVVHVVDLATGADQSLDKPGLLFRRPALSPDGTHLVAEAHSLLISNIGGVADTAVSRDSDLYLLSVP